MNPVTPLHQWYVYVLLSEKTGYWYIGQTGDLQKRILSHNSGKNRSTKARLPWKLIYCEIYLDRGDALAREKYLKSTMGHRDLRRRLKLFFAQGGVTG
jgi:putative endonuclease